MCIVTATYITFQILNVIENMHVAFNEQDSANCGSEARHRVHHVYTDIQNSHAKDDAGIVLLLHTAQCLIKCSSNIALSAQSREKLKRSQ